MVGCFVVGCSTGHTAKVKYRNFKIPRGASEETRQKWILHIPKRSDRKWDFKTCHICSAHFMDKFIVKSTKIMLGTEVMKEVPRQRWTLTHDAYPTIFSNTSLPKYYDRPLKIRDAPKPRQSMSIGNLEKNSDNYSPNVEVQTENTPCNLLKKYAGLNLPENWHRELRDEKLHLTKLVYSSQAPVCTYHAEKHIVISQSASPLVFINGQDVTSKLPMLMVNSNILVENLVKMIDTLPICHGVHGYNMFKDFTSAYRCGLSWISDSCEQLVVTHEVQCNKCKELQHILNLSARRSISQNQKKKIQPPASELITILRKKNYKSTKAICRLKRLTTSLKAEKKLMEQKFKNIESQSMINSINQSSLLTPQLKLALKTAVSLQKAKGKTGKRYSADWILQALLLKITSPKAYRHLRCDGILPLPHPNYLTKMLRGIKCQYGFNHFIIDHLKTEFFGKPRRDRQVFLCFDEMKVKEAISFDRANLRFTGFVDYEEFTSDLLGKAQQQKGREADHVLVFLVRSLNSNMTQPIGVFATRGAAPGHILAKMIVSAIIKLEGAGLEVAGVVSDGATTNKSAWSHLGVSGSPQKFNNKICNPVDSSRNIHFICDIPHIFKCIRNNFLTRKTCFYSNQSINWGIYEAVYDLDKQNPLRVVPKLTFHHIHPGPFQKMSVSKAVQVFSKTMADAISFYREHVKSVFLKNSEATEKFTRILNELFDVTNARLPHEGLKPDSVGYNKIVEFIGMLTECDTFATNVTLDSLRVTLRSTLDLIDYLCNDVGYAYALTAKFNQDCLEKFFGICRSFGGDDCHPTITSFGHVFRLLSIFNPTKRLIKGNVRADEEVSVSAMSYVDGLKQMKAYRTQEAKAFEEEVGNRILEKIVCEGPSNAAHSNSDNQPMASPEFIAFHLSGYVAFKGKRFTDCDACLTGLEDTSYRPKESALTELKNMGGLKYPSIPLHNLLAKTIEPHLSKISGSTVSSPSFMLELIDQFETFDCEGLGCCLEHSESLAVKILLYYITVRMYFYSKIYNREILNSVQKSKQKIKEGKLQ